MKIWQKIKSHFKRKKTYKMSESDFDYIMSFVKKLLLEDDIPRQIRDVIQHYYYVGGEAEMYRHLAELYHAAYSSPSNSYIYNEVIQLIYYHLRIYERMMWIKSSKKEHPTNFFAWKDDIDESKIIRWRQL